MLQYYLTFYLKGPLIYVINCKSLKQFLSKCYLASHSLDADESPNSNNGDVTNKYTGIVTVYSD